MKLVTIEQLIDRLGEIVGRRHVLIKPARTRRFRTGFRGTPGDCAAVVRPGSLVEVWRVLQACVAADAVILMQAANTGLTGGSTPHPHGYDRPVVLISTLRLDAVRTLRGGDQVICLPGATLYQLERTLAPIAREPHSVIGSSCFGASVIGGVCNNSGGALVRRGPAYTEMSLYAQREADGVLRLRNHLGLALADDPEQLLATLDDPSSDLDAIIEQDLPCSDPDYAHHVRDVEAMSPARYNADARRLHGASGSAGKVAVLAVRLDTFPQERETTTFYVGTNDPDNLTALRRTMLGADCALPIAAEYLHRDAFNLAEKYGKDQYLAIRRLGTSRLPLLNRIKELVDRLWTSLPGSSPDPSDRLLHAAARRLPPHLPARMREMRDRYAHHLLLKVSHADAARTQQWVEAATQTNGSFFVCTPDEASEAFLHRFVIAGAAVRYNTLHPDSVAGVLSLDIALPRNCVDWFERLPVDIEDAIAHKIYYGHFFCHVFHQDYVIRSGFDPAAIKARMLHLLDERQAEYPAEHNVGQQYRAKAPLAAHYRNLDPINSFNPGVGQLPRGRGWQD